MELDTGQQRLELVFEHGRLRRWYAHAEKRSPAELARFDAAAAALFTSREA